MSVCAIIPAAGRGTRLNADRPKLLTPLAGDRTVWDVLSGRLAPLVDQIHVVMSPDGKPQLEAALAEKPVGAKVTVGVQPTPLGMGDAIFAAPEVFRAHDHVLIIWGDQAHVSADTLLRCKDAHLAATGDRCTLPLVSLAAPYVEYRFLPSGGLASVLQSREGDRCMPGGLGDVGVFLLSTAGLETAWSDFLDDALQGAVTGEVNFLPFLPFLSARGWRFQPVIVDDANEARGINTPDDLAFFRSIYAAATGPQARSRER